MRNRFRRSFGSVVKAQEEATATLLARRRRVPPMALKLLGDDERLPPTLCEPSAEFVDSPGDERRRRNEARRALLRLVTDRLFDRRSAGLIIGSASVVIGIGAAEASLLVSPVADTATTLHFMGRYACEQLLPSVLWGTNSAELVAAAMGHAPGEVVRSFDPASALDAADLLKAKSAATLRSVVASFMMLAQAGTTVTLSLAATQRHREAIERGTLAPLHNVNECVVRLCGSISDTSAVAMARYGPHVLPVFEEPEKIAPLIKTYQRWRFGKNARWRMPVFWHVDPGTYSRQWAWEALDVSDDWFVRTSSGRKLLYMEADATNSEESLALGRTSTDLVPEDSSQAFRAITDHAMRQHPGRDFAPMRVFLGDLLQDVESGGGLVTPLRSHLQLRRETDIMIESQAPILQALLTWCEKVVAYREALAAFDGEPLGAAGRTLQFHTTSSDYFSNLREIMAGYNFSIVDSDQTFSGARSSRPGMAASPRIIYCRTTDETINAVRSMFDAGTTDPYMTCIIIDRHEASQVELAQYFDAGKSRTRDAFQVEVEKLVEGEQDEDAAAKATEQGETEPAAADADGALDGALDGASERAAEKKSAPPAPPGFEVISSPLIYDDLFRQVRQWTRLGFSPAQIQGELDTRFAHIHEVMLAQHWSRHVAADATKEGSEAAAT